MSTKEINNIDENILSEFERFSHPLLTRLAYEAPGTFHHSINVSLIAQKAAKAIDADSLLVRITAYYHDLGKLTDPFLFIENQSTKEIPTIEDANYIRTMAKKIIDHVSSGIELAEKYNLPSEVIDLIRQSHGTSKVLYFWGRAKENKLKIKKTDLSYPGPRPQSREAMILMLADSIEAATRAIPNITPEKIVEIVDSTIEEKKRENQFKDSNMTRAQITKIKASITETLTSIYHQRIMN